MGNFPLPAFVQNGAPSLRDFFAQGSHHDIDLQIDSSFLGQALKPGPSAYGALDLQIATLQLTHNPPPGTRSERVAVLFANAYAPNPNVLGVMFDRGKPSWWDDPNPPPITTASAREGCAVFLGAIAALRGTGFNFQVQAQFTTIHEMGHLFNLQHCDIPQFPPNFMATTQSDAPYKPNAFRFLPPHETQLAACSTSPFVWPGGAPFDGDSGDLPGRSPRRNPSGPVEPFGLQMSLQMSQSEFWLFEPVELEIKIAVAPGVSRRFTIPDAVDPGYETFVLWLEDPTGERRRYRSPRRYCGSAGRLGVSPTRPFRRDISIFADASGYTFRRPGVWRIWAEMEVSRGRSLASSPIEVNVRARARGQDYRLAVERLANPESALLLYHRLIRSGVSDGQKALLSQIDDRGGAVPIGGVEYALGRAWAEQAACGDDPSQAEPAMEMLRRACDRADLGEHRRGLASHILSGAAPPRRRRKVAIEIPEPPKDYLPVCPAKASIGSD